VEKMIPTITAFKKSPDRGQGLARDMTVRWALEEVGQPYEVRLVPFKELKDPAHRASHPFGKIPTFEEGDLTLFESGSIVLHIAETHRGLFSANKNERARAITWMFAALSTVEPPIVELSAAFLMEKEKSWYAERLPLLQNNIRQRLDELSNFLGEAQWLDGEFSAGDLMMVMVLRRLKRSGLMTEFPNVASYVERGEARPAFQRAFAAQLAVFKASESAP
jgi:glutathione S-transferase